MKTLYQSLEEELQLIVPIVERVHAKAHPEFYQVKKLYDEIHTHIQEEYDFTPVFESLRQITNNYTIPQDVCETYAKVYHSLADLDKAYQQ